MMGLYGGLLGLGAVPGPEKCDFTVSFAPMGSSEAAALVNSPLGRNVIRALEQGYTVCPMGSDTASSLRERIAATFLQNFGKSLPADMSVAALLSNPCLHNTVVSVSPPSGPSGTRCPSGATTLVAKGESRPGTAPDGSKVVPVDSRKISWDDIPGIVNALAATGIMVTGQILAAKKSRGEKLPVPEDHAVERGWWTPLRTSLIIGGVVLGGVALYFLFGRKKRSSAVSSAASVFAPKPIPVKAQKR